MTFKRTTLVIDSEQFKKLKAVLALEGISISAWLRKVIDERLNPGQKETID